MNKIDLARKVAEVAGVTIKDAKSVTDALFEVVMTSKEDIVIAGFGKFEFVNKEARMGHSPSTGEPMEIPARRSVHFKPGKTFKDTANA